MFALRKLNQKWKNLQLDAEFASGTVPDGKQPIGTDGGNQLGAMQKCAAVDKASRFVTQRMKLGVYKGTRFSAPHNRLCVVRRGA
jgi:hypothetical protein